MCFGVGFCVLIPFGVSSASRICRLVFGRIRDIFCHYFFENVSRPASLSSPPGTQGMMLGLPW